MGKKGIKKAEDVLEILKKVLQFWRWGQDKGYWKEGHKPGGFERHG